MGNWRPINVSFLGAGGRGGEVVGLAFAVEGEEVDVAGGQLEALLGALLNDPGLALEVESGAFSVQELVHAAELAVQHLRLVPPVLWLLRPLEET